MGTAWTTSSVNSRSSVLAFHNDGGALIAFPTQRDLVLHESEKKLICELLDWIPASVSSGVAPRANPRPPVAVDPPARSSSRPLLTVSQITADVNYTDMIGKVQATLWLISHLALVGAL